MNKNKRVQRKANQRPDEILVLSSMLITLLVMYIAIWLGET